MRRRVLLVDDQPVLLTSLKPFLEEAGYQVLMATDGQTALQMVRTLQPDAVVCDLHLPGMSGLELCHEIRRHPEWQAIQIVLFSGEMGLASRQMNAEAEHWLPKPFEPEDLLDVLRKGQAARSAPSANGTD